MIILVRHAQSEGNKNRDIHQTTPDHRVKLTSEGHRQALEAGQRLRNILRPDDTLHFFTSPYRRTRETTEGILQSLTSDDPSPSPFPRHGIKVYEEPRLREQDFGNFQPCSTEMERMWMERADYGHFFYRIPNGESAADAYDRVSGFNESLWRLFGEEDFASVCVLVTHGLMTRVFLMKWYHWSVEYFEDLRNINHCEFVIMTLNPDNGKYTLQNKLRTWSDLRQEREQEAEKERDNKGQIVTRQNSSEHVPLRRKWGGCPDGCTHGMTGDVQKSLRAQLMESMHRSSGHIRGSSDTYPDQPSPLKQTASTADSIEGSFPFPNDKSIAALHSSSAGSQQSRFSPEEINAVNMGQSSSSDTRKRPVRPSLGLHRDSEDHLLHPPVSASATANLKLALLHLGGRDGGGSLSGANSLVPSEDEGDHNEESPKHHHHHLHHHHGPHGHHHHQNQNHHHHPHHSNDVSSPELTATHKKVLHLQKDAIPNAVSLPASSQDAEDDGDDELSSHQRKGHKKRSHHVPSHTQQQNPSLDTGNFPLEKDTTSTPSVAARPRANMLGDADDETPNSHEQNAHTAENPTPPVQQGQPDPSSEDQDLETQRREDQSIQGSVY
ncbi:hypothetical protein N7539_002021 [Penicillium diatomitis]|uniref:Phosphoglycerate mutase family domain protein n=1 Tax=Penicillium diatomitis TaxID=2819901 RepID=A0A9W9XIL1_9EURO|nr:uncharacterized protein N7539_002021 [Penicillium diatomitis]KAJ5493275.1 hypothetical protein N7539_002021 [Penicillium diatomitis]